MKENATASGDMRRSRTPARHSAGGDPGAEKPAIVAVRGGWMPSGTPDGDERNAGKGPATTMSRDALRNPGRSTPR